MKSNIEISPFSEPCKNKLSILLGMLVNEIPGLSRAILFGSYARYEQKATSDLDILATTTTKVPRKSAVGYVLGLRDYIQIRFLYSREI